MGSVCVYMYVYTTSKPQEKGIQNVMESFKKVVPVFPCSCSLLLMVCFPNVSSFFSLQKKKPNTFFCFSVFITYFKFTLSQTAKGSTFPYALLLLESFPSCWQALPHRPLFCHCQTAVQLVQNYLLLFGNYGDTQMLNCKKNNPAPKFLRFASPKQYRALTAVNTLKIQGRFREL